jgi:serine/threonine protein kinase
MGRVYLARQETLNRPVCVKVLAITPGEDSQQCRERFRREAELLASLSHPHVLSVFDSGTTADSGLPFLVTEYVEGGDLRKRMPEGQPLPVEEVLSIVEQVGEALEYLHGKAIIHRDLKPENILMPTAGHCMVGDFGLAVMQGNAGVLTRSVRGLGTPGYVSPEQQYGLKVDERSDQYSLAALAYELLAGKRPLGRFAPPSQINPRLPAGVDPIILRGLAEEPADRFASVREFVTMLKQALEGPVPQRVGLAGWLWGLLVALAVIASCAVLARSRSGQGSSENATKAATRPAPPQRSAEREPKGQASSGSQPEHSPEFVRLTELRAYKIWCEQGSPKGKEGHAVKDKNWAEAERQIDAEVKARAYQIWEEQGRPEGAAGEAVREKNLHAAETQLLKETEEEFRTHPLR